tara:strand:- start:427 stop:1218 length:792 start_codon:yes stop_codon:yes gene_type:complete
MGLLEKAGQMQNEEGAKPAKKSKPKPVKAAKPAKKSKPKRARRASKKSTDDLDDIEVTPKVVKALPDEYILSKKPARFARSLVDFIVSFGWAVPVVALLGFGSSNSDPTYFIFGGALLSIFNLVAMPFMTNRTVGNYASLTQYVTHKGKPPVFIHQTLKAMTVLYVGVGLFLVLSAGVGTTAGANTVNLGIGLAILAIPLSDWIIAKIRHETKQGLWDSIFFAYMVSHNRDVDTEVTGFFGKLESSGDWLKDKGWLGDEKSED